MPRDDSALRRLIKAEIGLQFPPVLVLPQLRGAWYFSSVNSNGNLIDASAQSRTLTNTGSVTFDVDDYLPYGSLNGSSQGFTRGDESHLDITGDLTLISIAYFDNTAASEEAMAGKWTTTGNQRSYLISRDSDGTLKGYVSSNGTAETTVNSTQVVAAGDWVFGAVRYTASSELAIFTGFQGGDGGALEKIVNTTSIPASINNSNADFSIGAVNVSTSATAFLDGRVSITFLCAAAVSDDMLNATYAKIRQLFDV